VYVCSMWKVDACEHVCVCMCVVCGEVDAREHVCVCVAVCRRCVCSMGKVDVCKHVCVYV